MPDLSGSGGTRTLTLVPEGTVSGLVRFLDPADEEDRAFVRVEGRGFYQAAFTEKGKFTVKGLPPGRFTVRASPQRITMPSPSATGEEEKTPEATAAVSPGDTVELVVPARPR